MLNFILNSHSGGVESKLGPLGTSATEWPIVPASGNYDDGEFGGMKIGRGNRSTRRKPAPGPLCPPQISLDQTRVRIRAAAVGNQRLTAWAMARPKLNVNYWLNHNGIIFWVKWITVMICRRAEGICVFCILGVDVAFNPLHVRECHVAAYSRASWYYKCYMFSIFLLVVSWNYSVLVCVLYMLRLVCIYLLYVTGYWGSSYTVGNGVVLRWSTPRSYKRKEMKT
jgi:hypothetical protein